MTFYVRKSLAHGPIRFGVAPRHRVEEIDAEAGLSTGASGEFLRRGSHVYFLGDTRRVGSPTLPVNPTIATTPFLQSLKPDGTPRSWGFLAGMAAGVLLILLGVGVITKKGPEGHGAAGWFEVILGIALIATPLVLTAQKRRQIHLQEEKQRAEREERERREREVLQSYTAALERVRSDPSETNLAAAELELEKLDLPYKIWSPFARQTVLQVGFEALARLSPARAREVSQLMSRTSEAIGLNPEDEVRTKLDLYRVLIWHLLADDRVGVVQSEQLKEFRTGFDIWDRDVPVETAAAEEFAKLRGVTSNNLPRQQCGLKLKFREYCIHETSGTLLDEKGKDRGPAKLYVTNRRVVIESKKIAEVDLPQIDDLEVDVDANLLTIRIARPNKPMRLQVEAPIYTAAIVDLATSLDERPKGFA